jgi:hypothetical protein
MKRLAFLRVLMVAALLTLTFGAAKRQHDCADREPR